MEWKALAKCFGVASMAMLLPLGLSLVWIMEHGFLIDGGLPDPLWFWLVVYVIAVGWWTVRWCDGSGLRTAVGMVLTAVVVYGWWMLHPSMGHSVIAASAAVGVAFLILPTRWVFYLAAWVGRDPDPWSVFRDIGEPGPNGHS